MGEERESALELVAADRAVRATIALKLPQLRHWLPQLLPKVSPHCSACGCVIGFLYRQPRGSYRRPPCERGDGGVQTKTGVEARALQGNALTAH